MTNPVHLREARIDLDGRILVPGEIRFPPDSEGLFPLPEHEFLALSRRPGFLSLTVVQTRRNQHSGFFVSRDVGPTLTLTSSLGEPLIYMIRFAGPPTSHVRSSENAILSWEGNNEKRVSQALTGLRLEAKVEGQELIVAITADLAKPDRVYATALDGPQYWPVRDGQAARLDLRFTVDLITRAVWLGGYDKSLGQQTDANEQRVDLDEISASDLRLDTALLGFMKSMYGIGSPGPWVQLGSDDDISPFGPSLSFCRFDEISRYDSGFINTGKEHFPRIRLKGIGMETLIGMLLSRRDITISLEGTHLGSFDVSHFDELMDQDSGQEVDRTITEAVIDCSLAQQGLTISYRVFCPTWRPPGSKNGWFSGSVTLAWQLLIICHPSFARRWRSIWEVKPPDALV